MRRGKTKLALLAMSLAVIMLMLTMQKTVAYYTRTGTVVNVITSGDISARIIEKMGESDFPTEGVTALPGSTVSKKVSVQNTGGHPFWLRVKLNDSLNDGSPASDIIELDINLNDWTKAEDGFYYYNKVVEPGAETEKLFTQVKISEDIDNSTGNKAIQIKVSAYAVQSENNGSTPFEAAGWPAEGGDAT